MTTIEFNAQLLQQLSYIADNENYLQHTKDFIGVNGSPVFRYKTVRQREREQSEILVKDCP